MTAASMAIVAAALANAAGYTNFYYGSSDPADQSLWGTSKLESYDVAMKIADSTLAGMLVKEISVPVSVCDGISDYSIWLSHELNIESTDDGKVNAPDIASYSVTPDGGMLRVVLPEPVSIPQDGLYVGYSFKMTELAGDIEKTPLVVTPFTNYPESFYIHTNRSYKAWKNLSVRQYTSPVINVVVEGDFPSDCVSVVKVPEVSLEPGADGVASVRLHNNGGNPVDDIGYVVEIEGCQAYDGVLTPVSPIEPSFYGVFDMEIPLTSIPSAPGHYDLRIRIADVNGNPNASASPEMVASLNILSFIPTHKPLLEEYTGTWCGYCPRGYVGLEIMSDLYPDDFIGVSYHSGDDMEVVPYEQYPNEIVGYPDAWLDRVEETDAYSGRGDGSFGIDKVWEYYRKQIAPADISIKASFTDEDLSSIDVAAETVFAKKVINADYRLVFMLLGNGMSDDNWYQANNYSGVTDYDNSPYRDYWAQFVDGSPNVRGVVYNDILLACPSVLGIGSELPADIDIDTPVGMTYTFVLDEVVNVDGNPVVQDKNQLYVVVALVDGSDGRVLNANKVKVDGAGTVGGVMSESGIESVSYYDIAGNRVDMPSAGLYIRRTVFNDGTVKSEKILWKTK